MERGAYLALRDEFLDRLSSSLPVDGVLLNLHGAMEVEGIGDGEGDLTKAVREVVGGEVPIVATLDLHGNVSHELARNVNVLTALRTAPHRDGERTTERAVGHLVKCVEEGIRPSNTLVKLPLILPGEFAVTDVEPARSLYGRLADLEKEKGIIDASIMIGCAWADTSRTSVSVIVCGEGEEHGSRARELAEGLAREIWKRRSEFAPEVETLKVDEAIEKAMKAKERPVFISDSGDNVTAGGAGDVPIVLERLLSLGATESVVAGIIDPEAVSTCAKARKGSRVRLRIGGKLDRVNGYPIDVTGVVKHSDPRIAVIEVDGVEVVLLSSRWQFASAKGFQEVGINPLDRKIIVVKLGYLFPEIRDIARRSIMALSPGFTSLDIGRLPYERVMRPIFPLDKDFEFN
ncbi:MAG: M81 family metallopeptidase [Candidatus Brockarchaeota archaeon]|nr:M81 family metallopeptidase [Candidatus Brockarchaeota archaeon]